MKEGIISGNGLGMKYIYSFSLRMLILYTLALVCTAPYFSEGN